VRRLSLTVCLVLVAAGVGAALLAGCPSAGTDNDGGPPSADSGTGTDSGSTQDSGSVADAGPGDAGLQDAGPVNGCTDFTDISDQTNPTLFFGGGLGLNYSPKCAIIRAGQAVTFSGGFSSHPLAQTSGPESVITTPDGGTSATFTFNTTGTYGFECLRHAMYGMVGAIQVVDVGATIDAGVNGCGQFTDISAGDVTDGGNTPTITFGSNLHYEPQCASITAGQAVTFSGEFAFHPLQQTAGPAAVITPTDGGTLASFTFTQPGIYGYECLKHTSFGMKGAIQVQ
jgi:plastocyanin